MTVQRTGAVLGGASLGTLAALSLGAGTTLGAEHRRSRPPFPLPSSPMPGFGVGLWCYRNVCLRRCSSAAGSSCSATDPTAWTSPAPLHRRVRLLIRKALPAARRFAASSWPTPRGTPLPDPAGNTNVGTATNKPVTYHAPGVVPTGCASTTPTFTGTARVCPALPPGTATARR